MEGTRAAVLLSCYNGEKHLRTQIDSILAQEDVSVELYIRDDCSRDGTPALLRETAAAHPNVHVFYGEENLGYPACFYALTDREDIDADWFFFADQDDKWYPDKLRRALEKTAGREAGQPVAYFAGYDLCDGNLQPIRRVIPALAGKTVELRNTLYEVCGLEFTMAVNREAFRLLKKYRPRRSSARGTWMSMLYAALGEIVVDDYAAAAYRRHEASVTNGGTDRKSLWKWRLAHFRKQDLADYRAMLQEFEAVAGPKLAERDARMLHRFAAGRYLPNVFYTVFYPRRLRGRWTDEAALRVMFLLGRL